MTDTRIHTVDQLLEVLDRVVATSGRGDRSDASAAEYWSGLLTTPGHPLATQLPDEPLVDWEQRGLLGDLEGARVLDVGCGGARNTRWFAERGAIVDGIDLAKDLLDQLRPAMPGSVTLTTTDVLRDPLPDRLYDVVYDSGCFHHIAPHRRITYLQRVLPLVRPGGRFGIVTFAAERMEAPSDLDVVATGDTYGGMAFTLDDLRAIFGVFTPVELRAVQEDRDGTFAPGFLNAALFRNAVA
ncbi:MULTISPECIES: class I SAM-dependent methyltransferase [Kribbella]|uniref:Class I SAM-dependent methyltransferase n=1 Tax=Kribbella karoonensis TaxID=324851 RepID=A0ABN2EN94_9ACTN